MMSLEANTHNVTERIFKIWNKEKQCYEGSYSRAYHDEWEFGSADSALNANCHGAFKEPEYEIHEVEVTRKRVE